VARMGGGEMHTGFRCVNVFGRSQFEDWVVVLVIKLVVGK